MNSDPNEEVLFHLAAALDPAERVAFLNRECAGAPALRARLDALLTAHDQPDTLDGAGFGPSRGSVASSLSQDLLVDADVGLAIGRRYKLLERLGEGGCGVVYVAEQSEPVRRRVALKLIKPGMDSKGVIARFEAERQALAMMDHPNIAKVLDAGTTEYGRPYFVMELVRGIRITEYCDQEKLPVRDCLDLFIKVCQAIQHAHQKGIIHRDIKPSNILVTLHDGVPVPKVIDFGIAKATEGRLTDATVYTQLHQFIGTPAYISPEQAEMSGLDIDTRSDIYSLGVLLYELLTGVTPFDAKELMSLGLDAMRRTIREKEPVRPSTRLTQLQGLRKGTHFPLPQSALPSDLDWIVMKCLEKDRGRRYETANGLAADLKRHLGNEPVIACPPSAAYRFQKAWRRNRLLFAASALVAGVLIAGIIISLWQAEHATAARLIAQKNEEKARSAELREAELRRLAQQRESEARRSLARQYLQRGQSLGEQGDIARGLHWLARSLQEAPIEDAALRKVIVQGLGAWARRWTPPKATLSSDSLILSAAISSESGRVATGNHDGVVQLWSLDTGQLLDPVLRHSSRVHVLRFGPGGQRLLVGTDDPGARLWNLLNGDVSGIHLDHPSTVSSASFSSDGARVATGGHDGDARLWRVADGAPIGVPMKHSELGSVSVQFSPDSSWVLSTGSDGIARLWNGHTGEAHASFGAHEGVVTASFNAQGDRVMTASSDGLVRFWIPTNAMPTSISIRHTGLRSADFSPDGRQVLTYGTDGVARLWDAWSGSPISAPMVHKGMVSAAAFQRQQQFVLTGSEDGTVSLWDTVSGGLLGRPFHQDGPVNEILLSADSRHAVTRFGDTAILWNVPPDLRERQGRVALPDRIAGCVAFGADDRRLLVVDWRLDRAVVSRWDPQSGEVIRSTMAHNPAIWSMTVSTDSRLLLTTGFDGTARLWSLENEDRLLHQFNHEALVRAGALSPAGDMVATASFDRTARLWSSASGHPIGPPLVHPNMVEDVAFSPDGTWLATACGDGGARVWSVRNGQRVGSVLMHHGSVLAVKFHPDGKTLATGSRDRTVRFWDVHSQKAGLVLQHDGWVEDVAFTREGDRLATVDTRSGIRVWSVATGDQIGPPLDDSVDRWQVTWSRDGTRIAATAGSLPVTLWTIQSPARVHENQAELWVQVLTWQEMDSNGALRLLNRSTWLERRAELESLGGGVHETP